MKRGAGRTTQTILSIKRVYNFFKENPEKYFHRHDLQTQLKIGYNTINDIVNLLLYFKIIKLVKMPTSCVKRYVFFENNYRDFDLTSMDENIELEYIESIEEEDFL